MFEVESIYDVYNRWNDCGVIQLSSIFPRGKVNIKQTENRYLPIYEKIFSPIRNKELTIVEAGVGTGHSLNMWKEYFHNSDVKGIEIQWYTEEEMNSDFRPLLDKYIDIKKSVSDSVINGDARKSKTWNSIPSANIIFDDCYYNFNDYMNTFNIMKDRFDDFYIMEGLGTQLSIKIIKELSSANYKDFEFKFIDGTLNVSDHLIVITRKDQKKNIEDLDFLNPYKDIV
jgi:hypothetical protein